VQVISAALTEVASAVSVGIASVALAPIIWRAWTTITLALDDVTSAAATKTTMVRLALLMTRCTPGRAIEYQTDPEAAHGRLKSS